MVADHQGGEHQRGVSAPAARIKPRRPGPLHTAAAPPACRSPGY
jgi:hypothetical protein